MVFFKQATSIIIGISFVFNVFSSSPSIEEADDGVITMSCDGAVYKIDSKKFYFIKSSSYQGEAICLKNLGFVYYIGENWFFEEGTAHQDCIINSYQHKIVRDENSVALEVKATGKNINSIKVFSLMKDSPTLRIRRSMEFKNVKRINAIGLMSIPVPFDKELFRVNNVIENGKIVQKIQCYDWDFIKSMAAWKSWIDIFFVGVYDKSKKIGFSVNMLKEDGVLSLRAGMGKDDGFIGGTLWNPEYLQDSDRNDIIKAEVAFDITPFKGEPSQLEENLVKPYFTWLAQKDLTFYQRSGAKLLARNQNFSLWSELSGNKVFKEEASPENKSDCIELAAASGENEAFQLVLKTLSEMKEISIRISDLKAGTNNIAAKNITWNPVEYKPANTPLLSSENFALGDFPDTLLPSGKTDCKPGINNVFWITVYVPPKTAPGVYHGTLELLVEDRNVLSVPLKVKVWNFDISEQQTLTAAFDFWDFPAIRAGHRKEIKKLVMERRGGLRWINSPSFSFNVDGDLKEIKFDSFDASVEEFLKQYKHNVLITRCFMLGYGHMLRKTAFGTPDEVLSDLWKKKVLAVAKAFQTHLKEKGWNDKIVFDLFDEPFEKYNSALKSTIDLLKSVDPTWHFTFAGAYVPSLSGSVNFWNVSFKESEAARMLACQNKDVVYSVYNPPGYNYNSPGACIRANFWYLRYADITYVYQWLINDWGELGSDDCELYRASSWVVPSKNGPLSTIRFELTRKGIEDYEYITLLKKLIPLARQKGEIALAEKGEKLLARIPETFNISKNTDTYGIEVRASNDAVLIQAIRDEIGQAIDEINTKLGSQASRTEKI